MKVTKYLLTLLLMTIAITMTACQEEQRQEEQQICNPEIGETYCPALNECVQVWIEKCPDHEEYYREPVACTMEYLPVTGDITFPCEEGECTITLEFGNKCVAEAQGATNIQPLNDIEQVITITPDENMPEDKYEACEFFDGTPIEEHKECEGLTQEVCNFVGGEYFPCESACRHDPYAEVCIGVCVSVCAFN